MCCPQISDELMVIFIFIFIFLRPNLSPLLKRRTTVYSKEAVPSQRSCSNTDGSGRTGEAGGDGMALIPICGQLVAAKL